MLISFLAKRNIVLPFTDVQSLLENSDAQIAVSISAGSGSKAGFGSGQVLKCRFRVAAGISRQQCCGFRVG